MRKTVMLLLLMVAVGNVAAGELVKEFSGTGNATTSVFTVKSPWLLDWRLSGPSWRLGGSEEKGVALDITLIEAHTGRHLGRVLHTKYVGNGLKLFNEGGAYQLRISSTLANWTVKIEQIAPEDAKLYTPKKQN